MRGALFPGRNQEIPMFRAVVFTVLTLVLCRLGDGTVAMKAAQSAADVPSMEILLADSGPSPVDPLVAGDEELFPEEVSVDANQIVEDALADDCELPAGRMIPADHPLMNFDAWTSSSFPAFDGAQ